MSEPLSHSLPHPTRARQAPGSCHCGTWLRLIRTVNNPIRRARTFLTIHTIPLLAVYIKRAFFTDNYWLVKYPFFFAALCAERSASMGFSRQK
jgi:hypothetical protein